MVSFLFNNELQNGRSCLGDMVYRYITDDQFSPECFLDCVEFPSEHHILELANRTEAAIHVWRQKGQNKHSQSQSQSQSKAKKSSWGDKVMSLVSDPERCLFLAHRAELLLHSVRLRFPGLPQTTLDMFRIQYNTVILNIFALKFLTRRVKGHGNEVYHSNNSF